jgi:rhamnosyltransferase
LKASILIPTKNGEEYLEEVLDMVFKQKAVFANRESKEDGDLPFDFEVIIIDSGSKDKTLEIIRRFPQIKFFQIPPEEFNHGTTRNFLASKARGEYLVFITQDAVPTDENWLKNMMEPFEKDPEVAGVFGRQSPRKDCDPFQRKTLNEFMDSFGKETTIYQLETNDKEKEFEDNKHIFSFFSSANSALRKSVWEKIPFRHVVALGEDQFWAKDILLAGYKKAYQPSANVYHSHNFGIWGQFKRWFDEFYHHKMVQNYVGVSSVLKIPLLTLRLWFNDVKYIKSQNEYNFWQKIYWIIWIFFMDLARFCSEYLGARYDKLPQWLQNRLSMQYELINKK